MLRFMVLMNKNIGGLDYMIIESTTDKVLQDDLEIIARSNIPVDEVKDSTILITGATGLIGTQLVRSIACCNRIRNTNIRILALVRNSEKAKRIYGELLERSDIQIIEADIMNKLEIEDNIDYIIHCASITTSKVMITKPVETLLTSVEGTKNLLNLAKEKKIKSFVYVSSMEMYGKFEGDKSNVTEEDIGYIDPLKVRSNYPESKRICENMCIAYLSEYNVPVKIARLAQTFGAGILPGENRVFAQFAECVIKNKDIVLHTHGRSEGNFCYTRDAIKALITLLIKGTNGEAYNISNEETHTTIANMAKMVSDKVAKGRIKVVYDIPSSNIFGYAEDTKMKLDSSKIKELGWNPEVGLEEAYNRLISSMKSMRL